MRAVAPRAAIARFATHRSAILRAQFLMRPMDMDKVVAFGDSECVDSLSAQQGSAPCWWLLRSLLAELRNATRAQFLSLALAASGAFGEQHLRNNNSSRFGKFLMIEFDQGYQVCAGKVDKTWKAECGKCRATLTRPRCAMSPPFPCVALTRTRRFLLRLFLLDQRKLIAIDSSRQDCCVVLVEWFGLCAVKSRHQMHEVRPGEDIYFFVVDPVAQRWSVASAMR